MLVAQSLGRFGNYVNHELFELPTTLPWGLQIEATNAKFPPGLPAGTLFHPLFLYEIIWNLVALGITLFIIQTRRHPEHEPSVIRDGWVPRTQRGASHTEPIESSTTEESVQPTPRR